MPDASEMVDLVRDSLGPVERLAVAYAPAPIRPLWMGFLGLEARLERAARAGTEPVLAQIRLAWWRERFAENVADWPQGEPLLSLLSGWESERTALGELVDGWEAYEIGEDGGVRLRAARVEALLALARLTGAEASAAAVREAALHWIDGEGDGVRSPLPRSMRPLAVLRGLALREGQSPLGGLLTAMRIGLFGR